MRFRDEEDLDDFDPQSLPPARSQRLKVAFVAVLALVTIAGLAWLLLTLNGAGAENRAGPSALVTPPAPLPEALDQRLQALTAEQAVIANAEIKQSIEPIEPARSFMVPVTEAMTFSRQSASDCLTAAIFYEAASEADQGQRAVAQVILNRVRHPAYPNSVCQVVFQGSERTTGCQFSFTCDGSLARKPSQAAWDRARRIADSALTGAIEPTVGMATHYHTIWVLPYWAPSLDKITTVGAHIFYRWKGFWGRRSAFTDSYSGETSDPALGAVPSEGQLGPMDGLLLGGAPLDPGNALAGPGSQGAAALLPDSSGSKLHSDQSVTDIRADEARQRPAADEANGILLGPQSAVPQGQ